MSLSFDFVFCRATLSYLYCLPAHREMKISAGKRADEPRAFRYAGDVPSPYPPGTPGTGPLRRRIRTERTNTVCHRSAVPRKTRRMEPPGLLLSVLSESRM